MNQPAFPRPYSQRKFGKGDIEPQLGMTMRQWYKGMALASIRKDNMSHPKDIASTAKCIADDLLEEDEEHAKGEK